MSSIENKDKYVVYHGWVEGEAPFVLFDRDHDEDYERPKLVGGVWVDQEDVPAGAEYQDHFWVELDEDGEITALKYDSELTAEKKKERLPGHSGHVR